MRITRANKESIRYACLTYHYAKAVPVNGVGYNIYNGGGEYCGVVLFGAGACPNYGNEFGLVNGQVCELLRVALNGKQESTSQAVAMCLKEIKKDIPLCRLVISFADIDQNHLGTIYQATNWIYTGEQNTGESTVYIINGKKVHSRTANEKIKKMGIKNLSYIEAIRKYIDPNAQPFVTKGKRRYLYPLDKKIRKQILPLAKPYPKNEDYEKRPRDFYKKHTE